MRVILLVVLALFVENIEPQKYEQRKKLEPCSIASVSENDDVKCLCNHRGIYRCVLREKSNSTRNYEVYQGPHTYRMTCEPNRAYEHGTMTCICNDNGTWPHSQCEDVLKSLPSFMVVKNNRCKPNSYVKVDCNICRCKDNGEIDSQHCTNNECEPTDKLDRRHSEAENKIFGDCECGNWYSLAPCQFCFCVNSNKLVCNTGTSLSNNKNFLQLGSYNLHICGKHLGKDLRDLEYNNQDTLRQGPIVNEVAVPQLPAATSSPKPSTSQKPFTESMGIESETVNEENKQSHVKDESTNQYNNAVADDTSTESDEQDEEEKEEAKEVIMPYKAVTNIPFEEDEEEEYEISEKQAVTPKHKDYDEKRVDKLAKYHEQHALKAENGLKLVQADYKEQHALKQKHVYKPEIHRDQPQPTLVSIKKESKKKQPYKKPVAARPNYEPEVKKESRQDKEDYDDDAVSMSKGLQIPVPHNVRLVENDVDIRPRQGKLGSLSNLAFNMKVNLPKMLDQVFQLAMRRSMVSLDPKKQCTPGTVDVVKCNTCFCMKNSKMLCTAKKCD